MTMKGKKKNKTSSSYRGWSGEDFRAIEKETSSLLEKIASAQESPSKRQRSRKPPRGRVTIEVLDDQSSNPSTARSNRSAKEEEEEAGHDPKALDERHHPVEKKIQDVFDFGSEESRVRTSLDTFIPATKMQKHSVDQQQQQLATEQARVRTIQQNLQAKSRQQELDKTNRVRRKNQVEQDQAAVTIQSKMRQQIAQKECIRIKDRQDTIASIQSQWRVVRNEENGEVWYFNSVTGQSQWDPPEEIRVHSAASSSVDRFPDLSSPSKTLANISLPESHSSSTNESEHEFLPHLTASSDERQQLHSSSSSSSSIISNSSSKHRESISGEDVRQTTAISETDTMEDFGWHADTSRTTTGNAILELSFETEPVKKLEQAQAQAQENLFLADGSKSSTFSKTIQDTIRVSRFSSISSLIASQLKSSNGGENQTDAPPSTHPPAKGRQVVLGKKKTQQYLIAPLAKKKSSKGSKYRALNSTKSIAAHYNTKPPKVLSHVPIIRNVPDSGFDSLNRDQTPNKSKSQEQEKCFGCWISLKGGKCSKHDPNHHRMKDEQDSVLLCENWELDQLRRKYRAEELQEIFHQSNPSLRYDAQRKSFVTVTEFRHPIYRLVDAGRVKANVHLQRRHRLRRWMHSILEYVRAQTTNSASSSDSGTSQLWKLKVTMANIAYCRGYTRAIEDLLPVPPSTRKLHQDYFVALARVQEARKGASFSSSSSLLLDDAVYINSARPQRPNWIIPSMKTPVPVILYQEREYTLLPKRCVPLPRPSFRTSSPLPIPNRVLDPMTSNISWFERLCARTAVGTLTLTTRQIRACSPPPGLEDLRRTKHPKVVTVQFATFGRKPTKGNVAAGGLSAELLCHLLVTTYVPPQFGNFAVMDRRAICPVSTKDYDAVEYARLIIVQDIPQYVYRILEHALNIRRVPGIVIASDTLDYQFSGANRPEQTGEEAYVGFRTTQPCLKLDQVSNLACFSFVPSEASITPNLTALNQSVSTTVDRDYPFCEPTTKANTVFEFIHMLWTGRSSINQGQCFTNLGEQSPGDFMRKSDPMGDLGPYLSVVYRSWAFMQNSPYEEFMTDEGVAYWYDREQGRTFWERPVLAIEEQRGEDGDVDGTKINLENGESEAVSLGVGVTESKYNQTQMRKYMTKTMEDPKQAQVRKQRVHRSAKLHNILPAVVKPEPEVLKSKNPKSKHPYPSRNNTSSAQSSNNNNNRDSGASPTTTTSSVIPKLNIPSQDVKGRRATSQSSVMPSADNNNNTAMIQNLSAAIAQAMNPSSSSSTTDMIQLGISLGVGLGLQQQQQQQSSSSPVSRPGSTISINSSGAIEDHFPLTQTNLEGMTTSKSTARSATSARSSSLDSSVCDTDQTLSTFRSDDVRSLLPTLTPDEESELDQAFRQGEGKPLVNPSNHATESSSAPPSQQQVERFETHAEAGKGTAWIDSETTSFEQTKVPGSNGLVHRTVACLPCGFVESISTTRCIPMETDYFPKTVNLNEAKCVGVIKPPKAADEWLTIGYDPWSSFTKGQFGTQFVEKLTFENEEEPSDHMLAGVNFIDREGHAERKQMVTEASKNLQDLETLTSMCRHGKYEEIATMLEHPDWTLPIDEKDSTGNTLLSIACQNNMKRIVKLCLRKGADINTQNINGQTVLHYCHAYGFKDLAKYLMSKDADDTIVNSANLTCYEGLSVDDVDQI